MLTSDLDFFLPPELIAQEPARPRDSARLLRLCRARSSTSLAKAFSHRSVSDLPELLQRGDLLVFNDTRVLRARLRGHKPSGGRVEALLLREQARNEWEVLLKPSARLQVGQEVVFYSDEAHSAPVSAVLLERTETGWRVRFFPPGGGDVRELLPQLGEVPLPPYIQATAGEEDYQTIYARKFSRSKDNGAPALDSSAAPTAGLHFTPALLEQLQTRGVRLAFVTLGVGLGTFKPVQTETLAEHAMHEEEFFVAPKTAAAINTQKSNGGRVVAVGSTTTRVLESLADEQGFIRAGHGTTRIFIRPGYRFRCVDALLTNFHLPRSTLLALVAAFIENARDGSTLAPFGLTGLETVRYAYAQAIAARYRFFSFGDAMLIE